MTKQLLLFFFAITLLSLATSCEQVEETINGEVDRTFIIKAGNHTAEDRPLTRLTNNKLEFECTFDNSAKYTTKDPKNQTDINKLYGFSDCGSSNHHVNSARFGWRWYQDKLEIHAYVYEDETKQDDSDVADSKLIGTVDLNKTYRYSITISNDEYIFKLGNKPTVTMKRGCTGDSGDKTKLYPYFGGTEPAPQDITIAIKDL